MAVVLEVVDVDLEAALLDRPQCLAAGGVAGGGNDLEGALDSEAVVDVHQLAGPGEAGGGLDVVGHDGAAGVAFGPEPDEGNTLVSAALERQPHEPLEHLVDGAVHRPAGKGLLVPAFEPRALQVAAQRNRKSGPQRIVDAAHQTLCRGVVAPGRRSARSGDCRRPRWDRRAGCSARPRCGPAPWRREEQRRRSPRVEAGASVAGEAGAEAEVAGNHAVVAAVGHAVRQGKAGEGVGAAVVVEECLIHEQRGLT